MAKIDMTASLLNAAPEEMVSLAKLRYVNAATTGFSRVRSNNGFRYLDTRNKPLRDSATLARIKSLAIPPAWKDVWICPSENGHLQATGRDAKGRKQYRYHPRWRVVRDEAKYGRMIQFGIALPGIRKQIDAALKLPGMPREKALATVVYLLHTTLMRIGNEEYARTNHSFGLTTLRNRHVRIDGTEVEFDFRGKSGVRHQIKVNDPRLARIITRLRELPGQELFQYIDDNGELHAIGSADVNDYLRALTNQEYTAKDFRTWFGSILAALALLKYERSVSERQIKQNIIRAIEAVALRLGNTPAICRKCYIHPFVLEAYRDGTVHKVLLRYCNKQSTRNPYGLRPEEAGMIALLRRASG